MPRVSWPLKNGQPCVIVVLTLNDGTEVDAELLADTGGGSVNSVFDLILPQDECLLCGGVAFSTVTLTGAYVGAFPRYRLRIQIPALGFDQILFVAGVPSVADFDGLACFRFLNRFGYGNFLDPGVFGLET
jgi:hypothetical protein